MYVRYFGSDIMELCRDAAIQPLRSLGDELLETPREMIRPVEVKDFRLSLLSIRLSVGVEQLEKF